ncbi:AMP-binding protein [Nocardia sp. NPDC049220]|uniref:class I adenylate-forming enzyme family protein n=1 Tax=Nocardia sp. NPDC049220 TaxID=3155273 RepID=UPI0033FEEBD5
MILSTLPDCRAAIAPHAPAIADDGTDLDNTEFLRAVQRAATTLRAANVSTGDVVATMLPDTAALVISLFAIWRLGAAAAPINPSLTAPDAHYQMGNAGAEVLVAAQRPASVAPVRAVIVADELTATASDGLEAVRPSDDAPALILHTNGGAGRPMGMMLDHINLNAMCRLAIEAFGLTDSDHSLLILPLSQINGIAVGALSPLLAGGCATITSQFSPETFFDTIERSHATYFSMVPKMYTALSELPAQVRPNTSSVRFAICGVAPAGIELQTKFEHRYGIPIINGRGLTDVPARARCISAPAVARQEPSELARGTERNPALH